METTTAPRLLRLPEVEKRTGLGRSTIYNRMIAGTFPRSVPLGGGRLVGWIEADVSEWVYACVRSATAR